MKTLPQIRIAVRAASVEPSAETDKEAMPQPLWVVLQNARQQLVRSRDAYVKRIVGVLQACGIEVRENEADDAVYRQPGLLRKYLDDLPPALTDLLGNLLFLCDEFSRQIFEIEAQLQPIARKHYFPPVAVFSRPHKPLAEDVEDSAPLPDSPSNLYHLAHFSARRRRQP